MSKKLIAVASAAALALTALVGIAPANAAITVAYTKNVADADVAASTFATSALATAGAAAINVPANNTLEYTDTAKRSSLMKVKVTTVIGDTVTATSTGSKIVDEETDADNDYTSASGSTTFSEKATTTSVVFYVFATSTANASLAVTKGGNTETVWFKASAGDPYNVSVTAPKTVTDAYPTTKNVVVKVSDVFGNLIKTGTPVTLEVAGSGSAVESATPAYSGTLLGHATSIKAASAGNFGLSVKITTAPDDVDGLADAVDTFFTTVGSADLAAQVTALTAQVAALTADYNTLAVKFNKKVKKAKNKVALK